MVIDAGLPCTPDDVAGVLAGTGETVEVVSATHGHSDHVAGVPRLIADHAASLYLSEVTIGYLDGSQKPRTPALTQAVRIWRTWLGQPFDLAGLTGFVGGSAVAGFGGPKGMVGEPLRPARPLEDGQPLPGAPDWEVVFVPGHTDDALAREAAQAVDRLTHGIERIRHGHDDAVGRVLDDLFGHRLHDAEVHDLDAEQLEPRSPRRVLGDLLEGIVLLQERIGKEDMAARWKGDPIVVS